MKLNTMTAKPGAKKLCQLLTIRKKSVWDHRNCCFGNMSCFFKLFVFSIIRSFLFSVSVWYIFKMLVWLAVLRGTKKEVFVQFGPDF